MMTASKTKDDSDCNPTGVTSSLSMFRKKMFLTAILLLVTGSIVVEGDSSSTIAFNEIKFQELITKAESDALELARELERLYQYRCTSSLDECSYNNYNDCLSELPNSQCNSELLDQFPSCGGTNLTSCSGLVDFTTSVVRLPASIGINPDEPQVIESICFTRQLDEWFNTKFTNDALYWNNQFDGIHPLHMYFGSKHGPFRIYPGVGREECNGQYDPTKRPWYVSASSGPKNVIMILDVSGSMDGTRMDLLKASAKRIVQTLTVSDRIAIVAFESTTTKITNDDGYMYVATEDNKQMLLNAIDELKAGGATNFYNAFIDAFDILDQTIEEEFTVPCNTALLFFTDGEMTEPDNIIDDDVIQLVQSRINQTESMMKHPIFVFTYSVSEQEENVDAFPSLLACSVSNGVWSKIENDDEIMKSLSSYTQLFALGLSSNIDYVSWVEPYHFATSGIMGTTVSAPVYDRTKTPALLLGAVGIDFSLQALQIALVGNISSNDSGAVLDESIRRIVKQSSARCPIINLTHCEYESFRRQGPAGDLALCSNTCTENDFVQVEESQCDSISDYPNNLWNNTNYDKAGIEYTDRVCCSTLPSMFTVEQCLSSMSSSSSSPSNDDTETKKLHVSVVIVISVIALLIIVLLVFFFPYKKICLKVGRQQSVAEKNQRKIGFFHTSLEPLPHLPPPTTPKQQPNNNDDSFRTSLVHLPPLPPPTVPKSQCTNNDDSFRPSVEHLPPLPPPTAPCYYHETNDHCTSSTFDCSGG